MLHAPWPRAWEVMYSTSSMSTSMNNSIEEEKRKKEKDTSAYIPPGVHLPDPTERWTNTDEWGVYTYLTRPCSSMTRPKSYHISLTRLTKQAWRVPIQRIFSGEQSPLVNIQLRWQLNRVPRDLSLETELWVCDIRSRKFAGSGR